MDRPRLARTLVGITVAVLNVIKGAGSGGVHAIEGTATIGRGRAADVVLSDLTVSREHASASVEGMTLVVEDLGSSNGTWVNGERIEDAVRVGEGDVIQVGGTELEVRIETGEKDLSTPTEQTVLRPASGEDVEPGVTDPAGFEPAEEK